MPRRKTFKPFTLGKKYPKIVGLEELVGVFNALGAQVEEDKVYDVLMDAGDVVKDEVRSRAPYNPKRKKGTHLRDAVFVSEGDPSKWPGGPNILVGVSAKKAPHRHLVEYGTAKMAAKPYWRPGMRAAQEGVARTLKAGIGKLIDQVAAKGSKAVPTPTLPYTGGGYDE
mgnify:CR=1 FL=1